jgi:hypothetical protein
MTTAQTAQTARSATVAGYVALAGLVTAVLTLAGSLVRLLGALVGLLAALVEKATPARAPKATARAPEARDVVPLRLVPPCPAAPTPVGPIAPTAAERLDSALRGLGFAPRDVARVVGQLGPRVDVEPLQALIPIALRALTPTAIAS